MKLTIDIYQAVLDVYNDMEGDLYSEEMKAGLAFKLMKFEFEKKIVKAVMDSYNNHSATHRRDEEEKRFLQDKYGKYPVLVRGAIVDSEEAGSGILDCIDEEGDWMMVFPHKGSLTDIAQSVFKSGIREASEEDIKFIKEYAELCGYSTYGRYVDLDSQKKGGEK